VNWIEVPPPDDTPSLKSDGFQVLTNSYDHIWPWIFDTSKAPWDNPKVRQAANYAINREAMSTSLLHDTSEPAYQLTPRANLGYDKADDTYSYDPQKAKDLLKEAGYADGVKATVSIPTSGSGNMLPVPMNEELQQDLAAVGIKVEFKPIEWAAMLQSFTTGKVPDGASAVNISLTFQAEATWNLLFNSKSPINVGHYSNPQVDELFAKAQSTLDDAARFKLYQQASALITKDAAWLMVVNDLNPRVLSSKVHGFVEPKSWFVDLTTTWVG
jgi:peptide/nickel transport system substrate-binding protein